MKTPEQSRVVVIDDNPQFLELVQAGLAGSWAAISTFQQADAAAFHACEQADAVVLDLHMPDAEGVDVLRQLADAAVKARLILNSGQDQSVLRTAQDLARAKVLSVAGAPEGLASLHRRFWNRLFFLGAAAQLSLHRNEN